MKTASQQDKASQVTHNPLNTLLLQNCPLNLLFGHAQGDTAQNLHPFYFTPLSHSIQFEPIEIVTCIFAGILSKAKLFIYGTVEDSFMAHLCNPWGS